MSRNTATGVKLPPARLVQPKDFKCANSLLFAMLIKDLGTAPNKRQVSAKELANRYMELIKDIQQFAAANPTAITFKQGVSMDDVRAVSTQVYNLLRSVDTTHTDFVDSGRKTLYLTVASWLKTIGTVSKSGSYNELVSMACSCPHAINAYPVDVAHHLQAMFKLLSEKYSMVVKWHRTYVLFINMMIAKNVTVSDYAHENVSVLANINPQTFADFVDEISNRQLPLIAILNFIGAELSVSDQIIHKWLTDNWSENKDKIIKLTTQYLATNRRKDVVFATPNVMRILISTVLDMCFEARLASYVIVPRSDGSRGPPFIKYVINSQIGKQENPIFSLMKLAYGISSSSVPKTRNWPPVVSEDKTVTFDGTGLVNEIESRCRLDEHSGTDKKGTTYMQKLFRYSSNLARYNRHFKNGETANEALVSAQIRPAFAKIALKNINRFNAYVNIVVDTCTAGACVHILSKESESFVSHSTSKAIFKGKIKI